MTLANGPGRQAEKWRERLLNQRHVDNRVSNPMKPQLPGALFVSITSHLGAPGKGSRSARRTNIPGRVGNYPRRGSWHAGRPDRASRSYEQIVRAHRVRRSGAPSSTGPHADSHASAPNSAFVALRVRRGCAGRETERSVLGRRLVLGSPRGYPPGSHRSGLRPGAAPRCFAGALWHRCLGGTCFGGAVADTTSWRGCLALPGGGGMHERLLSGGLNILWLW